MKKYLICLAFLLGLTFISTGQTYFQATVQNSNNVLIFKLRPVNGNITLRFSAIELFVRIPTGSPAFAFGTPVVNPAFTGMIFTPKGPNLYGAEAGFNNYVFEWIGGAVFVPASSTTYNQNVEYELFRVPLVGAPPATLDLQLVHNTNTGQFPTYINISDNLGASWSCIDTNTGATLGNAFYGPGFTTAPAPNTFINHILQLSGILLPVKFTSFTATKKDNDALLNWTVENETSSTDYYEIERSVDGITFEKVQTITPLNNGNSSNAYNNIDANLTTINKVGLVVYYRIKQVDIDGKFTYTDIKNVRLSNKENLITAYPNPIREFTNIQLEMANADDVRMSLLNADGKILQDFSLKLAKGINIRKIDMNNLPTGNYVLKVLVGEKMETIKLIKL